MVCSQHDHSPLPLWLVLIETDGAVELAGFCKNEPERAAALKLPQGPGGGQLGGKRVALLFLSLEGNF